MEFINSYGTQWNNGGFFQIGDLDFFKKYHFFEIYRDLSNLNDEEEKKWKDYNQNLVKEELNKEGLFNYKIECPNCKQISKAKEFNGTFYKEECPLCNFSFVPNIGHLAKTLYLKQNN